MTNDLIINARKRGTSDCVAPDYRIEVVDGARIIIALERIADVLETNAKEPDTDTEKMRIAREMGEDVRRSERRMDECKECAKAIDALHELSEEAIKELVTYAHLREYGDSSLHKDASSFDVTKALFFLCTHNYQIGEEEVASDISEKAIKRRFVLLQNGIVVAGRDVSLTLNIKEENK